ncbi:hypothetical protein [Hansschlegelia plantiphila]|uniref:Uncharacterized protein n=1 Tax=Hansschlegelia plantiphila TaxID=374655 RepID=A0A9W6J2C3_9HYPH|nr:hypothetical protein [Hansschlegelia plantiphila]GLK68000.1 hypothetical protein GCM10008179_16380 [Hansschlegelia plantiphila]
MGIGLIHAAGVAIAIGGLMGAAEAQMRPPVNIGAAVGDVGPGWKKQPGSDEGITYVCDAESCGGRGVLGLSQAAATPDYVKGVIADPDKMLASYQYASEESMKPTGCAFVKYEVKRLGDRRVRYDSTGKCPQGSFAAMTTIFDADRPTMMAVQVLTGSESGALKLRDASADKIVHALEQDAAAPAEK